MQTGHHGEHHTFPANKMVPVSLMKLAGLVYSPRTKKFIKLEHTRRSRRYLKAQLRKDNVY